MADRNDFKLLKQRCLRHFELAKYSFDSVSTKLDDNQKARYGFYFFVIQNLTNIVDYDKIIESITDTDFNSTFFNTSAIEGFNDKQGNDSEMVVMKVGSDKTQYVCTCVKVHN